MNRLIVSEPSIIFKKKLNEYINENIDEKNEFNFCTFDFEENSLEEILDCLQTPAFGSEKKVVVCKNPYFFKDSKIKLPFTNDFTQLEEYLKNPNPDSELIIICTTKYYTNKSKYINMFTKYGEIINLLFENEEDLYNYMEQLISSAQLKITPKAKQMLFQRCIDDVCKLEKEITKLVLYHDQIDEQIVDKIVSKPIEDDVFELSNALLEKNHQKIMKIYDDLKTLKIEPIYLISLLANQYRLILQTAILKKKQFNEQQIATKLGIHPYRIKLAFKYLNNYSIEDIKKILIDLAELDAKIKIGEFDRYINFELFLATK